MDPQARILIDPTPEALAGEVRAASERARSRAGLAPDLAEDEIGRLHHVIAAAPEGWREWAERSPTSRFRTLAQVIAVWWSDHLGRRHVGLLESPRADGSHCLPPGPLRPPLECLYPSSVAHRRRHGRTRHLVLCDCGAWGEPAALGWMGPCCGP
ncbi:MAG: hypothetical protein K2W96_01880, partial [Gemmataceae bacterium]|nr:hypothetical protein [Gemmataceae bacterium]